MPGGKAITRPWLQYQIWFERVCLYSFERDLIGLMRSLMFKSLTVDLGAVASDQPMNACESAATLNFCKVSSIYFDSALCTR